MDVAVDSIELHLRVWGFVSLNYWFDVYDTKVVGGGDMILFALKPS